MCPAAIICKKFTKTSTEKDSRSFKVIDVGTPGKCVCSACYDKHQFWASMWLSSATVFMPDELIAGGKIMILYKIYFFWRLLSRKILSPRDTKFCHNKTRVLAKAGSEDFLMLAVAVLIQWQGVRDRRTDRQMPLRLHRHANSIAVVRNKILLISWLYLSNGRAIGMVVVRPSVHPSVKDVLCLSFRS